MTRVATLLLAALGIAFLAFLYFYPILLAAVAGLVLLGVLLNAIDDRRLRRLAREREGESICTFARALDRKVPEFDPRIVRAVWEALEPYVSFRGGRVPLRPIDTLEEQPRRSAA